jgi:hypothetical protein
MKKLPDSRVRGLRLTVLAGERHSLAPAPRPMPAGRLSPADDTSWSRLRIHRTLPDIQQVTTQH